MVRYLVGDRTEALRACRKNQNGQPQEEGQSYRVKAGRRGHGGLLPSQYNIAVSHAAAVLVLAR